MGGCRLFKAPNPTIPISQYGYTASIRHHLAKQWSVTRCYYWS